MENTPTKEQIAEAPSPEVLQPQAVSSSETPEEVGLPSTSSPPPKAGNRPRHMTYRPSHKATFIGLAVVVAILVVNAAIIAFVIRGQDKEKAKNEGVQLEVSQEVLDKLGVNRSTVGDSGIELIINPNTRFSGKVEVGGDVSIAGELKLNSKFSATSASLTQLEAGETSLASLNVNGDATASNLTLRNDFVVTGSSRLQGAVTMDSLLTVNNNVNVAGNVAVGGELLVNVLHVSSFISDGHIIVGGHFISQGSAPSVSAGSAVGSNGTVSISGNDLAGTVAVNTGVGAGSGTLASITFNNAYGKTPHVLITSIGAAANVYVNRNASGFSIAVSGALSPGGYAFDYFVIQ